MAADSHESRAADSGRWLGITVKRGLGTIQQFEQHYIAYDANLIVEGAFQSIYRDTDDNPIQELRVTGNIERVMGTGSLANVQSPRWTRLRNINAPVMTLMENLTPVQ
jgi:hypothetical protein